MNVVLDRLSLGSRKVTWDGSATSEEVDLEGGSVAYLFLPSAFLGTAVTVEVKVDGSWKALHHDSSALSVSVSSDAANVMPPELFTALGKVRFVSTTSETCEGSLRPVS